MNKADDDKHFSYDIVPIASDDRQIVIEFLKEFFFQREPLVVCLKFSEDVESLEKLQNYAFKTLDDGLNFKAISTNGDLMGVILSEIMTRDNKEQSNCYVEDQENESIRFRKFMNLFQKIGQESNVFGKYPEINRIMDIKLVAVNDAFKGRGVCKALFDKTKQLALENECSMVHIECSSYFSARAAEKLGYQCIYSLPFREYKNENGQMIFNTPPPHGQFKVYVLSVENKN